MAAKKQQNAIDLLKADHRKVEGLFEAFEKARGDERKKALVRQICTELSVHTSIEEEIFYPACRGEIEDSTLNEAYVEHDGAKVMLAELEASDPTEQFYDAKVKVLSEEIKHHVKEEEQRGGMFAQAKAAGIDLVDLGARMAARKKELLGEIKTDGLPTPETRSFVGGDLIQSSPDDIPDGPFGSEAQAAV
jgi:hypothetical protein